jgi:hypothetical protein
MRSYVTVKQVALDKRGAPNGVRIDANSGVLTLPPLFEEQLYSIVVVATALLSVDSGTSLKALSY